MSIALRYLARASAPLRIAVFFSMLLMAWLPVVAILMRAIPDSNTANIVSMALLFGQFLGLVVLWGWLVDQKFLLRHYGLSYSSQNFLELVQGIGIGAISLGMLFGFQGLAGWVVWVLPNLSLVRVVLEGLLIGIGVGLAEELLFRGYLLNELERSYSPRIALWGDSVIFAVLHFIRPVDMLLKTLPQFPGLVLLGLILVWAKRSHRGRLGFPIGLHSGLVVGYYIVNVGQLVQCMHVVPDWVSGIDQNPLSGVTGLVFLSGLALWVKNRPITNHSV